MFKSILSFIFVVRGERRELVGKQRQLVALYALGIVLFHMVMISRYYWGMDFLVFLWLHLGTVGTLAFLLYSPYKKEQKLSAESVILAAVLGAIMVYSVVNREYLIELGVLQIYPRTVDQWLSWVLLVLVLEGARRAVGLVLPLLVVALGAYAVFVEGISPAAMNRLMFFQGFGGLWGVPLQISATVIILVMTFAGVAEASGGIDFLRRISARLLGSATGGAAKMAVLTSAGYGMVAAGAPSNVAVTGCFTIPAMLRSGFKPAVAGAVESVASTGGAITPPVMSSVVFVMAAIIGIPYISIIWHVIPVTAIFYLILFLQIHWIATKQGIRGIPEKMQPAPRGDMIKAGSTFSLGIVVLIVTLAMKYTLQTSFIVAISSIIAMMLLTRGARGWRQVVDGLIAGGYGATYLVFIMAIVSVFIEVIAVSGLDMAAVRWVLLTFGDMLFPMLILGALLSLVMGMSGSSLAAYIMAVMLVIPALIRAGAPVLPGHMFALYFGVMAYITPPICTACFVASRFVNESYWKIGWESIKLALPLWVLPFVFIYRPELLLLQGSVIDMLVVIAITTAALVLITAVIRGMPIIWIRHWRQRM